MIRPTPTKAEPMLWAKVNPFPKRQGDRSESFSKSFHKSFHFFLADLCKLLIINRQAWPVLGV